LTYTASLANGAALPLWLNFSPATRTFSGTPPADALSNLTIKVTANDGTGLTVSDEFVLTLQGTVEVHRINAGGPQVSTSLGVFLADARFSGGTAKSYTKEIANTTNDVLYQSERYGAFSYNIPVSNGQYNVVLHFAENYYTAAGKRVFDVSIEGVKVLANYDIFSKVGLNTATTETFVATVGDGTLNINFTKILDNAKVSAIEVIKVSSTSTAARSSFEAKATDVLVNYYPNPFTRTFTLKIHRKGQDKLPLKIYNAFGREVMQLENLLPEQTVTMGGEFSPGVYILMVGTGDQARWYKVVKAK
jgi:hypothetical protein